MLLPGRGYSWGHPASPFLPLHSCMGPAAGKRGYEAAQCSSPSLGSQPWQAMSLQPLYMPSMGEGLGQEHILL